MIAGGRPDSDAEYRATQVGVGNHGTATTKRRFLDLQKDRKGMLIQTPYLSKYANRVAGNSKMAASPGSETRQALQETDDKRGM